MKTSLCLFAAAAVMLSTSGAAKEPASRVKRGDLVVMGYATTSAYDPLDEWGMSSAITANLRIARVIRGRAPARDLTIRYIAHADLPKDRALRFHLRRSSTATWLVCKQSDGQGYICK